MAGLPFSGPSKLIIGTVKPVIPVIIGTELSDLIKEVAAVSRSLCTQLALVGIFV